MEPDSPARGKLAAGDVVEAVGGEKGELKPVKTPLDFVLAIRGLRAGRHGAAPGESRGQGSGDRRAGRQRPSVTVTRC